MKPLILILALLLIVGCITATPTAVPLAPYKAIYLTQDNGQPSKEDLEAHPEISVTNSFDEFKQRTQKRTALWIDINATGLVDRDWLNQKSQKFYPIVLVGNSNALCSFRDTLGGFGIIQGPYVDCSSPPSGFSVWTQKGTKPSDTSAFMEGYEQIPTAQDILEKTNLLLEGKNPGE